MMANDDASLGDAGFDDASFGHWVMLRRSALHFTRAGLARRVGCAVVTLRKIEADQRRPSEQIAERLAECLRLTPKDRAVFVRAARGAARVDQLPHPASLESGAGDGQLSAQQRRRHRLPHPLTALIGRDGERDQLRHLLTRPDPSLGSSLDPSGRPGSGPAVRLVTLTGPPGIGKTRLALQTALDLRDAPSTSSGQAFRDGASFVQLAPIQDPHLVLPTIAQHLNVPQTPGRSTLEQLAAFLHDWQFLLVLDNFEQVVPAAAELAELLAAAPQLKLLVTSRVALNLSGEQRFAVPPLASPDPHALASHAGPEDALTRYAATRLFLERARAIRPGFAPDLADARAIAHICQRLDGLPLAIELAAARLTLFRPAELLARLDRRLAVLIDGAVNLPARQRTLRGAIQWSYDLLDAEEQRLFRLLGVFAGGWTLEATQAVCTESSPGQLTILHLVESLINKSLVKQDDAADGDSETRFSMLETLREFALERLEASGEAEAVRHRHANFFVEFAERVQPNMHGDERNAWYRRFDAEQANLRAALGWALATGHAELGLRLAGALGDYWFWWSRSWHEGWSWISQLLALPMAQHFPHARATALRVATYLLSYLGESAQVDHVADESLSLFRELGDKPGTAWIHADKGLRAWSLADYAQAVMLLDESITLFRETGDLRGLTWALTWRAATASDLGQFEEATILFEASVTAAQTVGDAAMLANAYRLLGDLAYYTGDYERATALHRKAMVHQREANDPDGESYSLASLARIALAQGDLEGAAAQFEASEAWFREAQQMSGPCWILHHLGYVRHLQGDDRAAHALLREALTLQQQQLRKLLLTESLERCAWVAADMHQPQRAARLFGAAKAARERIGAPLPLGDRPMYDRHLAQARADLDGTAFDAAWAEGRKMTLEQAVEYALAEQK
jgi:predicted ATPase/transcriptional regulator with XRE-family HTH domain